MRAARVADVKSSAVAPVADSLPPGRAGHAYALPINKEATMRGAPGGIIGLIILVVVIIIVLRLLGIV